VTVAVATHTEAERHLIAGKAGARVGEWAILAARSADPSPAGETVALRPLAREPLALVMPRDPAFRPAVVGAPAAIIRDDRFPPLFTRWFVPAPGAQVAAIRAATPMSIPLDEGHKPQ
jgi:hypothetical protein